jgi:hypothetical protein
MREKEVLASRGRHPGREIGVATLILSRALLSVVPRCVPMPGPAHQSRDAAWQGSGLCPPSLWQGVAPSCFAARPCCAGGGPPVGGEGPDLPSEVEAPC